MQNQNEITNELEKSYNELPYRSSAFAQCSPLHLEACGRILDINPQISANAKILEIGCSYGGNLIPFAFDNPNATIVGIDLSGEQIKKGSELVKSFNLNNLKLIQANVCDIGDKLDEYGKFDYIITHGVYSWVPKVVRDAILELISQKLAPNGVAYVSYNTYPGWKVKEIIRDYMLFVSRNEASAKDKVTIARKGLEVYKKFLQGKDDEDSKVILNWIENTLNHEDHYIAHEFLEAINVPFYFIDFVDDLHRHGLDYLCESDMNDLFRPNMGVSEIDDFIAMGGGLDRVAQEQFLDFYTQNRFRQSLIVHKDAYKNATKNISVKEINRLHIVDYFAKSQDGYKNERGVLMSNSYEWLYLIFNQTYPQSINLGDLVSLIEPSLKLSAYLGFIEILSKGCKFYPKEMPSIRYEVGKTRLKQALIPYVKYFLKEPNPVISFANETNRYWKGVKQQDFYTLLKFDGKNDIYTIANEFLKFVKTNNITLKDINGKEIKGVKNLNEFAINYILDIEIRLAQEHFFEIF